MWSEVLVKQEVKLTNIWIEDLILQILSLIESFCPI